MDKAGESSGTGLPHTPANYAQERRGVAAVQSFAAERAQIWRETPTGDVGIDGQLEYVDENGLATGKTLAVQIKCGPSYFQHETYRGWKFYPEGKHQLYWERYPLPVILVLHDPTTKISYWTDARQSLRRPGSHSPFIEVPRKNILEKVELLELFENTGLQSEPFVPELEDVLSALVARRTRSSSFPLSYFDLFAQGLTNICRQTYFGMDLASTAAEFNMEEQNSEAGIGLGSDEYDFLFGYVRFLVGQHLADVDFSDCLIDWVERHWCPVSSRLLHRAGGNSLP